MISNPFNEILVATVGLTPETVTETIYYYYKQIDDQRIFSDFKLVTTEKDKVGIIKALFDDGWLGKLEQAIDLKPKSISLTADDIIVIKDENGKTLEDVRSTEDANQERLTLFRLFHELTQDENTRLTVSIAGGRKTTSASIALALQIYGREQDDLIHVMVPENKRQENTKDPWFFPENDDEKIEISNLPIIKTRKLMGESLPIDSPENLMEMAQLRLNELTPIDSVIIKGNDIMIDSEIIQLSPIVMMVWRYMARNKTENCTLESDAVCPGCSGCYVSHGAMIDELDTRLLHEYEIMVGENSERYKDLKEKLAGQDKDISGWNDKDASIRQYRSKLNKKIKEKAPYYLQDQLIPDIKEDDEGNTVYGLKIAKKAIKFEA